MRNLGPGDGRRPPRRRRLIMVTLVVTAVLAVVGTVVLVASTDDNRTAPPAPTASAPAVPLSIRRAERADHRRRQRRGIRRGSHPDDRTTLDAAVLPAVIDGFRADGYRFVTLDALL